MSPVLSRRCFCCARIARAGCTPGFCPCTSSFPGGWPGVSAARVLPGPEQVPDSRLRVLQTAPPVGLRFGLIGQGQKRLGADTPTGAVSSGPITRRGTDCRRDFPPARQWASLAAFIFRSRVSVQVDGPRAFSWRVEVVMVTQGQPCSGAGPVVHRLRCPGLVSEKRRAHWPRQGEARLRAPFPGARTEAGVGPVRTWGFCRAQGAR